MEIFGEDTYNQETSVLETESIVHEADPLKLNLDDETFVEVFDKYIKDSRAFFESKNIKKRRESNLEYYLGQQTENMEKRRELRKYNVRYQDNLIYEAEHILRAVALSKIPDLLVAPGNDTPESKEIAETLTNVLNSKIRKRENRRVLSMAYRHRPLFFIGVIKYLWDSELGRDGDYKFECVHPDDIDMDHTATVNDQREMRWIAHHYNLSIKEILMRWPNKKAKLLEQLQWDNMPGSEEQKMASVLKISEIWFTWYDKVGDKYERTEGVAWKYRNLVFDKKKNPYWDWEGEKQLFTFDNESGKRQVTEDEMRNAMMTGGLGDITMETVYHNYFSDPRKPFIFLGFNQLGKQPLDETTRIEQSKLLQDNVNLRGRQISELTNLARGKSVFSTLSGLDAKDVAEIDMADPEEDLLVEGSLRDVYMHIPGILPTAALFQEQDINRNRLFSKMGTNAALRGQREGSDPGVKTQLFKESDYTKIDIEVEDTINYAAEQMAEAAMQMIKLFYTEKHLQKIKGADGKYIFEKINRDIVEDGMEVEVSASSVDKLRRKSEAYDMVGIKMSDPLSFFQDIEATDPEGRAEKIMLFMMSPELYYQKFIQKNENTMQMAQALGQQPVAGQPPVQQAPPQMTT